MTSIFNRIHRLKRQPGWTWERFLGEIAQRFPAGIDEKTLYAHYREPQKRASRHITLIIQQLHEERFPDPFPEAVNRLMRLYNNLALSKRHPTRERDIEDLEFYVAEQLRREDGGDCLRAARLSWLLGNIQFDRIPIWRDNGQRRQLELARHAAIGHYRNSVALIERHNDSNPERPVGPSQLYKARHNILACYLNAVPQSQRTGDPEILKYLRESNYLSESRQALAAEPFQWSIARNGLRFSSMMESEEEVRFFFEALVAVSPRFLDLDFELPGVPPLSAGTEFQWAIRHVLTPTYLDHLRQRCKERK